MVKFAAEMSDIAPILLDWYARCGRDLPWRRTRDPYLVWLSEVILQQTRVAQGRDYYLRFAERFPDVRSLAAAGQDEVMKLWQGLGYYSRARNLHAAARQIVAESGGVFPRAYADVRSLRGVGEYTAAAICSAAYDEPVAAVDGNVYRVLARLFDIAEPIDTTAGRRLFAELAAAQLDTRRAGRYNQAVMDFGALQCTPAAPRCDNCPLAARCLALAAGTVGARPVKRGGAGRGGRGGGGGAGRGGGGVGGRWPGAPTAVRPRWFHYLHVVCGGDTFVRRREGRDIWQGLYEFPLVEMPEETDFLRVADAEEFRAALGGVPWRLVRSVALPEHRLSHQRIHAVFHRIEVGASAPLRMPGCLRIAERALGDYAMPRLLENYLSREEM